MTISPNSFKDISSDDPTIRQAVLDALVELLAEGDEEKKVIQSSNIVLKMAELS
jgi:hypothetical protein